jgi:hypothetical protein
MPAKEQHLFKERFLLMKYASDDGTIVEWIWNSRNGVTPFCVHDEATGILMSHTQWQFDVRIPHYQPLPGERVFVDMTPEIQAECARKYVTKYWQHPDSRLSNRYNSLEQAIADISSYEIEPGSPALISGAQYLAQASGQT